MQRLLLALILCSSFAGVACDSAGTSPTTTIDLTGTFSGTGTGTNGPGIMSWQLTQVGKTVGGTAVASNANASVVLTGSVTGTLTGTSLTFTLSFPPGSISAFPACGGTFVGTAVGVTDTTIAGGYSGSIPCSGTTAHGDFTLTRLAVAP